MLKIENLTVKINKLYWTEFLFVVMLFIFNIILVYPKLLPEFSEINPHDGAKYIESGRMLFIWGTRELSWGPIVALIYAPIHLFVWKSPNWFMIEAWAGNFIMFSLIWFSFYYLSRQIKHLVSPYIMIGLMIVLTAFSPILRNQSDAVFLVLSTFALANLIKFNYLKKIRYFWLSSLFVSLGVLARVETIILVGILLILGIVIGIKKYSIFKLLIACTVPTIVILLVFAAINMVLFGTPNFGIASKSYDSLQWNQAVLTGGDVPKAYEESEKIFGSQEENQGSVIKAMTKNPKAILERIFANVKNLPEAFLRLFGSVQGFLILLFSSWGFFELIRKKEKSLVVILLCWPLHVLIVLIFLADHFIPQISYIFYLLSAIGICSFFRNETNVTKKIVLLTVVLITIIFCIVDHRPIIFIGSLLFFITILIDILLGNRYILYNSIRIVPVILLICIGLVFREPLSFPTKALGITREEKAVHYLEETLPKQSNVLSYLPIPTVAARMNHKSLGSITQFEDNPEQLREFLINNDIEVIFLDKIYAPKSREIAENYISLFPQEFTLGYESADGIISIYLRN